MKFIENLELPSLLILLEIFAKPFEYDVCIFLLNWQQGFCKGNKIDSETDKFKLDD